ncbi:MAG: DUF3592 domain-containing protein [Pseudomonadales bacterium]|nr:DUF3592 domain-containing protein [Pseudomonadales bacterium]MBO6595761.1 DUF3592 domain-containing protein [Pseudomonadales bacterium]MBO6820681.1 DUF3592 domain-containing protein [Pseudomonadales bacterium]
MNKHFRYVFNSILAAALVGLILEVSHHTFTNTIHFLIGNFESTTTGTIVQSRVVRVWRGGDHYRIVYDYIVDGQNYQSSVVKHSEVTVDIELQVQKYPVGQEVVVYYDVDRPQLAVLENVGLGMEMYVSYAIVIAVFVFALIWHLHWHAMGVED